MTSEVGPIEKGKWYVYMLKKSLETNTKQTGQGSRNLYVGMTNHLEKRVGEHNSGKSKATQGYEWELIAFFQCENRATAAAFEGWLKTGDTKKKREDFALYAPASKAQDPDNAGVLVKKALLWRASQQLRNGIFKGVRNIV